jgi:hypothetical protein
MSKSRDLPKPQAIFRHAAYLASVDKVLRSHPIPRMDFAAASMLLGAFTIELLLKCMLVMERKEPPNTHQLNVLFRQVSHKRQRRVVELWEEKARPRPQEWGRQTGTPTDLPNALVKCGRAFDQLRYAYEDPDATLFFIGDLPQLLMTAIVESEPDWIKFGDGK